MKPNDTQFVDPDGQSTRLSAAFDLVIVVAVLVIVKQALLPYTFVFAGPASTLSAMIVGTVLLYRRGLKWSDLGFRWPESWLAVLGWSVVIFIAFLVTVAGASAFANLFFADVGTSGRFDFVRGDLAAYLLLMLVVWTHGSFFEELLFRAFIITKLSDTLGGMRGAGILAAIIAAVFFGYRHYYYQGMNGAVVTGAIGLLFGLIYLRIRNTTIWPLILVHGAVNTIGQTSRYLG